MAKNSIFSGMVDKLMAKFVPQEAEDARLSINGTVVVKTQTPDGKQWVDKDAVICPEEFLSDLPVYTIAKTFDQIKVGDIVKVTNSTYATVVSLENGKVETTTFGGQHREAKAFKDMCFGQPTIRVVVNLLAGCDVNTANGMSPIMLLSLLNKDSEDKNDSLKTMMLMSCLSGQGANLGNILGNPMALGLLMGKDSGSAQDMMLMLAMQNGAFNGLFGAVPAAKPAVGPVEA